MVQTVYS